MPSRRSARPCWPKTSPTWRTRKSTTPPRTSSGSPEKRGGHRHRQANAKRIDRGKNLLQRYPSDSLGNTPAGRPGCRSRPSCLNDTPAIRWGTQTLSVGILFQALTPILASAAGDDPQQGFKRELDWPQTRKMTSASAPQGFPVTGALADIRRPSTSHNHSPLRRQVRKDRRPASAIGSTDGHAATATDAMAIARRHSAWPRTRGGLARSSRRLISLDRCWHGAAGVGWRVAVAGYRDGCPSQAG